MSKNVIGTGLMVMVLGGLLYAGPAAPPKAPQNHGQEVLVISVAASPPVCSVLDIDPTTGAPVMRPALGLEPSPDPLPVPPGPSPGPTPPGPLNTRAQAFKNTALLVQDTKRDQTAQGLAMMYRQIAKSITPTTTAANLETTIKFANDSVFSFNGNGPAWQKFRDLQAAQWAAASLKGVPELGSLLTDMADGLDAAAPKSTKQIDPAFWAFLLKLLEIIMALLAK